MRVAGLVVALGMVVAGSPGAAAQSIAGAAARGPVLEAATSPAPYAARVDRFEAVGDVMLEPNAPALAAIQARKSVALMVVGGALLVGGLLIDDDVGTLVSVAGVAIGAYGLYLYLR